MTYPRRFTIAILALVPGASFLFLFIIRSATSGLDRLNFTLFDDAMISMTYAKTLASTGEWVWFPGAERVQGFTNPLWTLYMALLHALGLEGSGAALAVSVTGAIVLILVSLCVIFIVNRALGQTSRSWMFACIAGGSIPFLYPLTYWTLRGMEVGLLALLLLVSIVGVVKLHDHAKADLPLRSPLILISLSILLGIATRMDFSIFAAALLVLAVWWVPTRGQRMTVALVLGVTLAVTIAAILLFQQLYWGSFLPNTYRLKVDGYSVLDKVSRGVAVSAKLLPFLVLTAIGMWITKLFGRKESVRISLLLSVQVLLAFAYSIWVGGDAWEYGGMINRYTSVVLPAGVAVGFIGGGYLARNAQQVHVRSLILISTVIPISGFAYGSVSNPNGVNALLAISAFSVLFFFTLLFVAANLWNRSKPDVPIRQLAVALLTGLLFIVATSGPSYWLWIKDGGLFVEVDQQLVQSSLALSDVTNPEAVVATAWAGAPVYYSNRPAIDLLGKSDSYIASLPPQGPLHPGHNKWDYDYSINSLRPDVVRELFTPTESSLERLQSWGYELFCFDRSSAYFLLGSDRVLWDRLTDCDAS